MTPTEQEAEKLAKMWYPVEPGHFSKHDEHSEEGRIFIDGFKRGASYAGGAGIRWVKASERLPEAFKRVIVRWPREEYYMIDYSDSHQLEYWIKTDGTDKEYEWLDESPSVSGMREALDARVSITADNELAFMVSNSEGTSYFVLDKIPTEVDSTYFIHISKTPGKYDALHFDGGNMEKIINEFNTAARATLESNVKTDKP